MRYGNIAIIGRTNVGKSTFLNSALGMPLAIVSRLPQTTRDALLGVVNSGDAQLAFVDTPGLHRPHNELGRRMNQEATDSLRGADLAVFMTDIYQRAPGRSSPSEAGPEGTPPAPREKNGKGPAAKVSARARAADERSDMELLELIPPQLPVVLVINKVDRLHDKTKLLPLLQSWSDHRSFAAVVPISAKLGDGVERVLSELVQLLPEGEGRFGPDEITDRPVAFFAREYIREQVLGLASREVPHAVAVTLDLIEERSTGMHVAATLHVEKVGQRSILVGKGGEKIKEIGSAARQRLSELTGQPVHLKLFVRVTERWRNVPRQLAELGYTPTET
jgi:GTP-binding protein Era